MIFNINSKDEVFPFIPRKLDFQQRKNYLKISTQQERMIPDFKSLFNPLGIIEVQEPVGKEVLIVILVDNLLPEMIDILLSNKASANLQKLEQTLNQTELKWSSLIIEYHTISSK